MPFFDRDWSMNDAGSAPSGRINPFVLDVFAKAGVDVSPLRSKSWDRFKAPGAPSIHVVRTVCESAAKEPAEGALSDIAKR